jgi:hypothetical protein
MASNWFNMIGEEELENYPELLLTPFEELDLRITQMQIHRIIKRGRLTIEEERDLIHLSHHEQNILERGYNRGAKKEETLYNE